MANGTNHLPKPDPVWVALGIIVAAIAAALGPTRRARFFDAMEELSVEHETRAHVLVFTRNHRRDLPRSAKVASHWLNRLVVELRAAWD